MICSAIEYSYIVYVYHSKRVKDRHAVIATYLVAKKVSHCRIINMSY